MVAGKILGDELSEHMRSVTANVNVVLRRYDRQVAAEVGPRVMRSAFESQRPNNKRGVDRKLICIAC